MSKQEILSWTSLATSTSVVIFYALIAFGWPEGIPDYSTKFVKFAFNAFWIAVVIEMLVQISESKTKVQKDERDFLIEAKGLKAGYTILVIAVMIALVQLFLSGLIGSEAQEFVRIADPTIIFHFLFLSLFIASTSKRIIMIYQYRKDA
ncbi:MAG: hypothetical protein BalsKO_29080 [Balneolaceae bacterium]